MKPAVIPSGNCGSLHCGMSSGVQVYGCGEQRISWSKGLSAKGQVRPNPICQQPQNIVDLVGQEILAFPPVTARISRLDRNGRRWEKTNGDARP